MYYKVIWTEEEEFDSIEQARKFRDTLPKHARNVSLRVFEDDDDV